MTPPGPANLLRAFQAVYLLNLPDRTDRLRESLAALAPLDAEALSLVEVVPGVRATEAHGFPSIGAYGCFQAHLSALRQAHACSVSSVLVLEDDLHVERALHEDWPRIGPALSQQPWDLVNLGFHPDFNQPPPGPGEPALFRTDEPLGLAHCYAVSGEALPRLIAYLEAVQSRPDGHPRGGAMHFDGALHHYFLEHPGSIRLRPHRSLVGQRSSRSDIAGARWFDRDLPLVRSTIGALRTLHNRFR